MLKLNVLSELIMNNKTILNNTTHIIKNDITNNTDLLFIKNKLDLYNTLGDIFIKNYEYIEHNKIYELRDTYFPLVFCINKNFTNNIIKYKFIELLKIINYNLLEYFIIDSKDENDIDIDILADPLLQSIIFEYDNKYFIIYPHIIINSKIQIYIKNIILNQIKYNIKIKQILNITNEFLYNIFMDDIYEPDYLWLIYGYNDIKIKFVFNYKLNKIDYPNNNIIDLIILLSMNKNKNKNTNIIEDNYIKYTEVNRHEILKLTSEMRNKFDKFKSKDIKTHTYMPNKDNNEYGGIWNVPDDKLELWYDIIYHYIINNIQVHIVERRNEIHPIIIDLDIRQSENTRQYTDNTIQDFIILVNQVIKSIYPNIEDDKLQAFICEKKYKEVSIDSLYKDGIHIIYPYININYLIQLYIRSCIINDSDNYNRMKHIFNFNIQINKNKTEFHELYDDSILKHPERGNGWFIYGCNKPNSYNYEVKYILNHMIEKIDCTFNIRQLMTLFSMRNKTEINNIIPEDILIKIHRFKISNDNGIKKHNIINNIKKSKTNSENSIKNIKINGRTGQDSDIDELIKPLVLECLSNDRLDDYNSWIRVGWCLSNIDARLYSILEFTKKSKYYKDETYCKDKWDSINDNHSELLSIGSLIHWAKHDNFEQFSIIRRKSLPDLIHKIVKSKGDDHVSMRTILYNHLNGLGSDDEIKYVCVKLEKNSFWYHFNNIKWDYSDGDCIRNYMSENSIIRKLFEKEHDIINLEYTAIKTDDKDKSEYLLKKMLTFRKFTDNILCNDNYLKRIETCCKDIFTIKNDLFYFKLNDNPNLIGFNNGVYDLINLEFRPMRGMDLVTYSTGYDYNEDIINTDAYNQVWKFLITTLPNNDVREYTLQLLASFIWGVKKNELLTVFKGRGANGKSILINLISTALGDYEDVLDISKLTQKRKTSETADPAIASLPGKRVVVLQEPDGGNEFINVGILKEFTGGDEMKTRPLYKDIYKF